MTDEGLVYYVAVPLRGVAQPAVSAPPDAAQPAVSAPPDAARADVTAPTGDETTKGVFVSAVFVDEERNRISGDLRIQGLVTAAVIAAAALISWITAGRLLRPLRSVTETARTISEHDLSQRIPVENDDEVGELAETFNQMLDRLEQSFASQRSFIDDAGHELRTPITIVMGQLELMGESPEDREQTLAVVNDELARMARIVEDLLLLAKAEQPNFIALEATEVSELTAELFVKARTLGERTWTFDGTATGTADLDQQRLHQAALNLARNAVEHTDEGIEVGIGSEIVDGSLRLWVRDRGPGIAVEDQQRIFERFSRGRGARRRSDGAGLGLAIASAVASGHGGTVTLDSGIGLGSKFTIVIPLHPNVEPADVEPGDTEPGNTEPGNTEPGNTEPGDTEPGDTEAPELDRKGDDASHPHR
ncbi:MAG: HAMP domain-containing protein [Actinobacteria bacterium]|nr:HAMP domain-containing protein [Actinomycetota bacterium]